MLDRSLDTSLSFILLQSIFDLSILTQKLTQLDFKTTFPIRHNKIAYRKPKTAIQKPSLNPKPKPFRQAPQTRNYQQQLPSQKWFRICFERPRLDKTPTNPPQFDAEPLNK